MIVMKHDILNSMIQYDISYIEKFESINNVVITVIIVVDVMLSRVYALGAIFKQKLLMLMMIMVIIVL